MQYKTDYEGKYKEAASTFGGHAYDAFMILVDTIKKVGTDPEKVRDAIENTKGFVGTGGVFNMYPTDHNGLEKRESDGIVYVQSDLCVGRKACLVACPWGAAQWNPQSEKAVKCDLCMDRMDQGLKPVCVTVCTTQCLSVKEIEEPPQRGPR